MHPSIKFIFDALPIESLGILSSKTSLVCWSLAKIFLWHSLLLKVRPMATSSTGTTRDLVRNAHS